VFRVTLGGTLQTLYSFCSATGCADGAFPAAALVQATNGYLYGTTQAGGNLGGIASQGAGTIFKISPTGAFTTLYSFCSQSGCPDGSNPSSTLFQATHGDLFGTTQFGGTLSTPSGGGTVFKITESGAFTSLYSFCINGGECQDGQGPIAGLVQASNGFLYGTTFNGGTNITPYGNGAGTIFRISEGGTFEPVYDFCYETACADGAYPYGGLIQSTNGTLYGTTQDLFDTQSVPGASPWGTIFALGVHLGPLVQPRPNAALVGTTIAILGTNLTGASSVSFNGTPAAFIVVSSTEITATVPAGATSGVVTVVTPAGELSSLASFQVLP
jgi:uncharacterized repeat protein (TIGR03803 family)